MRNESSSCQTGRASLDVGISTMVTINRNLHISRDHARQEIENSRRWIKSAGETTTRSREIKCQTSRLINTTRCLPAANTNLNLPGIVPCRRLLTSL